MIAAFLVKESFSHTQHYQLLEMNCLAFKREFGGEKCEFLYYLKAVDPDRFFFIRSETKDREKFVEAAKLLAENLDFVLLSRKEIKPLLVRIDLDKFY